MNNQLPTNLMEQIELKAVHEAALQFHPVYSPDQNTACRICYRNGATEYAQWKLKYDELVADNERLRRWKAEALTLLSLVDTYADKHPEIKLGQGKVEFTIALAKERDKLKERCNKMALELRRCSLMLAVHPDYQPNSEFRDRVESIIEALKEGESNTPAPGEGEKEVDNG